MCQGRCHSKIILGIDPGTIVMGYGIILVKAKAVSLIDMGVLKLSSKEDAYQRLEKIHKKVSEIYEYLSFKKQD